MNKGGDFVTNMLDIISLNKIYGRGENKVQALKDINLSIEKGKFIAIIGPSGSGKSTLLNCIAGLDNISSGKVLLEGKDISTLSDNGLSKLRSEEFGFIFQSFNLIPVINVYENIILPISIDDKKVDKGHIDNIINKLGLKDKINKFPNELSGGQQQRVAIARALANKPKIIFADEPTGNLDSKTTDEVMNLLNSCVEEFGQTLVMITHNNEIAKMADICIEIRDGKIKYR
ncbi:ABC transporter ATP-binding protein,Macrolide export ATP-binding/permease protein MacB,putative ABC transporter ATP-binding protein YbbA,Predicted ABC-type transport system involved in lysophospholipase L1 biosynthesis, ATPase component,lipoprotein releasing system, ATP-binding protein,ABC transporter [[Clostridium] sordellii]|nr:ABC transporter ATP-binding protein,Macrolide export ATP-binding/permease protein MacB,putative ABC transporter ATP-binding protein YbbA,Predicted ABC-type transport system involved in lysophospholipase L1 biosynthesis, ATPase component,lipoprotein releasing system, ATP-binding protein,ABC transporter [[Clostridium] sordellii] [Paeniclostridium sordellii]